MDASVRYAPAGAAAEPVRRRRDAWGPCVPRPPPSQAHARGIAGHATVPRPPERKSLGPLGDSTGFINSGGGTAGCYRHLRRARRRGSRGAIARRYRAGSRSILY